MFLNAVMIATCLIVAPDSESLDGTRLLIEALVQMKEFEDERLGRFPPQFILTWKQDPSSFSDRTPIDPDEHRARVESLQPLICEIIEATQAEPGPFDVSMMPERFRENMIHLERRNALLLLLTDAEQLALDGKPADAVTRYIAACGLSSGCETEETVGSPSKLGIRPSLTPMREERSMNSAAPCA